MDVLLVGSGTMGQWVGAVFSEEFPGAPELTFLDSDPTIAQEAADRFDADTSDPEADGDFDVVCIAVPMFAATGAIAAHAGRANEAVFDVTGRMAEPLDAMETHAGNCEQASFHPLFAPANEPGSVPVVRAADGPFLDRFEHALSARGNEVFQTTAAEHDQAMETVQAKTHAAVLAFALAGDPVDAKFQTPISEELLALARRVTSGSPRVYGDIQEAFDGAAEVASAAGEIAQADGAAFEQLYNRAREDL